VWSTAKHGAQPYDKCPLSILGIPSSLNFAVMGGVILIGVIVDQQWSRYRERRQTRVAARDTSAAAPLAERKAE